MKPIQHTNCSKIVVESGRKTQGNLQLRWLLNWSILSQRGWWLGEVYHPTSTVPAMRDAHVMDMGWAMIDWVDVLHPVMNASGYVRCPCKGHGVGCLRLFLKARPRGDMWYEIHRHCRCHFMINFSICHYSSFKIIHRKCEDEFEIHSKIENQLLTRGGENHASHWRAGRGGGIRNVPGL